MRGLLDVVYVEVSCRASQLRKTSGLALRGLRIKGFRITGSETQRPDFGCNILALRITYTFFGAPY